MPYTQPLVFAGDLVRAIHRLQPSDEATRRAITELLGYTRRGPEPQAAQSEAGEPWLPPAPPEVVLPREQPTAETKAPTAPRATEVASAIEESSVILPEVHFEGKRLADHPRATTRPVEWQPLLVPRWTPAIVSTALSTIIEEGPLDIERIIGILVRGEPIPRLPRLESPTLRLGAQVLVDASQAVLPFVHDQQWLVEQLRAVVGDNNLQILRFIGSPLRGAGVGRVTSWGPYPLPRPGTAILLLSDLGIGRPLFSGEPASFWEWQIFAADMQQWGCPVVAFVPYRRERWPASLARLMTIVPWDVTTTAGSVRRALTNVMR